MTCECISKLDKVLAPHNTRLDLMIVIKGGKADALPSIQTCQVEKGRGKARAMAVSPSFCPWCGIRYDDANTHHTV